MEMILISGLSQPSPLSLQAEMMYFMGQNKKKEEVKKKERVE
jgi:hypothetical protein